MKKLTILILLVFACKLSAQSDQRVYNDGGTLFDNCRRRSIFGNGRYWCCNFDRCFFTTMESC